MDTTFDVLIIEPNIGLSSPYRYLPRSYNITRVSSVDKYQTMLESSCPDLIFISTSIGPTEEINVLYFIKRHIKNKIPAIIMVVDLHLPLSFIVGITWGGQLAIVDTSISRQELFATLSRVL